MDRNISKEPKTTPKPRKQREPSQEESPKDLDPEQMIQRQAQRDIDEALSKIKPKKMRRDLIAETDADEMIQMLLEKMREAASTDAQLNEYKQPAIAKLKLLPIVEDQMTRSHLSEQFLENGVLEVIRLWLEPCEPDGLLPVLDIQKLMLKTLATFNLHSVHLRESGVGKIVNFYSKHSDIPEVQKLAVFLVGNVN